ncbi:hypothetical protein Bbelb_206280 [Branchiostoma belcheri]|nr:hypothetical protein Bbelb_206280 [Branchiostoma belcheri]
MRRWPKKDDGSLAHSNIVSRDLHVQLCVKALPVVSVNMDFSQPDLSQGDETPCFMVENSQLETQAEGDYCNSDGEDVIFRHKMLAKLSALRDSSTSPIMEVEMMANGHKCHITMTTGAPGQPGGSQHPGPSEISDTAEPTKFNAAVLQHLRKQQ